MKDTRKLSVIYFVISLVMLLMVAFGCERNSVDYVHSVGNYDVYYIETNNPEYVEKVATSPMCNAIAFLRIVLVYLRKQIIDGYLISPKVYGKTNNVNPLLVIMAVSIGGSVAGIIGIIAALPVYLFLRTTYQFFKKDLKKKMGIVKKTI